MADFHLYRHNIQATTFRTDQNCVLLMRFNGEEGRKMKIRPWLALILACLVAAASSAASKMPSSQRQQELMHLLLADCGSCHGMTMNGGLGPPLRQDDLAGKPDEYIFITIRDGTAGTPMPPWHPFLTDDEILWMVDVLRNETWKKQ
jgi:cytochrome c55X